MAKDSREVRGRVKVLRAFVHNILSTTDMGQKTWLGTGAKTPPVIKGERRDSGKGSLGMYLTHNQEGDKRKTPEVELGEKKKKTLWEVSWSQIKDQIPSWSRYKLGQVQAESLNIYSILFSTAEWTVLAHQNVVIWKPLTSVSSGLCRHPHCYSVGLPMLRVEHSPMLTSTTNKPWIF